MPGGLTLGFAVYLVVNRPQQKFIVVPAACLGQFHSNRQILNTIPQENNNQFPKTNTH